MSYYSVLAVTPTTEDWIPAYIGPANALVARHGGTFSPALPAMSVSPGRRENDTMPRTEALP